MAGEEAPRSGGCGARVLGYVLQHMRQDGDSERRVQHKAVWVMFMATCFVASLTGVPGSPTTVATSAATLALFAWAWGRREVSEAYLRVAAVVCSICICYYDLLGASRWVRNWPLFIILIDVLLVIEAPRYLTKAVVAFVVVWLVLIELEYSMRVMGLFDLPDAESYDSRRNQCSCEKPPCASHQPLGVDVNTLMPSALVFLLDFSLTRGFADKVLAEKNRMAAAVSAAEFMAGRLANFDLEAAAAYLNAHSGDLPEELTGSFHSLLTNLDTYRPYLPTELFRKQRSPTVTHLTEDICAPIPGLLDRQVALVFTDIRSSTSLWEHSRGAAMKEALRAHDDVMRTALASNNGYEVKTIGDSIMASFVKSIDALQFGHAAQTALGAIVWPEGLMRAHADDGFAMLMVRMGIHCGEAVVQRNALTDRLDYFGPTVNRAARVEAFGAPGAVTVTAEVMEDVGGAAGVEGFIVVPYAGVRSGKGLKVPLVLTALIPQGAAKWIETHVRTLAHAVQPGRGSSEASLLETVSNDELNASTSSASDLHSAGSLSPASRRVFSAAMAERACVGVIRFNAIDLVGPDSICAGDSHNRQVTRAEQRLQVLYTAVQRTRGHVSAVVSGTAWASWGVHTPCTQHVNESARCMILLRESLSEDVIDDAAPSFHAGLVTGPLATVELAASSKRRFVTLLGACVELGAALCSGAASRGVWALAAAAEGSEGDGGHVELKEARRVKGWSVGAAGVGEVEAYELDLASLALSSNLESLDRADVFA